MVFHIFSSRVHLYNKHTAAQNLHNFELALSRSELVGGRRFHVMVEFIAIRDVYVDKPRTSNT